MALLENFDPSLLIEADNIFMTYDNIVQVLDIFILEILLKQDNCDELFSLGLFKNCSDRNNLLKILNRKDKNLFSLLSKDDLDYDVFYNQYTKALPLTSDSRFTTDFIKGFRTYISTKCSADRIVVATGENVNKREIVLDILSNQEDKIEFVDDDDETIEKFIADENFSLIITDRTDIVKRNIDKITNKVICFPYMSFLFENEIVDGETVSLSKDRWEIISFDKPFTIGFFEPFKITKDMFVVG